MRLAYSPCISSYHACNEQYCLIGTNLPSACKLDQPEPKEDVGIDASFIIWLKLIHGIDGLKNKHLVILQGQVVWDWELRWIVPVLSDVVSWVGCANEWVGKKGWFPAWPPLKLSIHPVIAATEDGRKYGWPLEGCTSQGEVPTVTKQSVANLLIVQLMTLSHSSRQPLQLCVSPWGLAGNIIQQAIMFRQHDGSMKPIANSCSKTRALIWYFTKGRWSSYHRILAALRSLSSSSCLTYVGCQCSVWIKLCHSWKLQSHPRRGARGARNATGNPGKVCYQHSNHSEACPIFQSWRRQISIPREIHSRKWRL